ncbi:unnamed protein product [Blepharisma stoltei]|uniref:Metallo-beta-lactamase domain-containing protein n=1 Tax=Blepharisma stoltei TaxID=1481888 RepID=A0AAU9K7S5_9CILI|nr:unnamed protein product [Blepharisma stoltei]
MSEGQDHNSGALVRPEVTSFFHEATNTICYVAACPNTKKCIVLDPVMDYDPIGHRTSTEHSDTVIKFIKDNNLEPVYIIDTHVHADHLTGSLILKEQFPDVQICIGFNVTVVQEVLSRMLNLRDLKKDGSQFDHLFADNEEVQVGELRVRAIHTPGHTPACMTYIVGDAVFTGDTIFMHDFGTARCDFPGGSAETLYESVKKIYMLPDNYRVFVGHDYGTDSREVAWESSIGLEKNDNLHLNSQTAKEKFVEWRTGRDRTLALPRLIMQSLQVNLRAGRFPAPESNGISYFKLPINPRF